MLAIKSDTACAMAGIDFTPTEFAWHEQFCWVCCKDGNDPVERARAELVLKSDLIRGVHAECSLNV
jgi:hypothetical protein